jgi:phenylacetate-CoA ligase
MTLGEIIKPLPYPLRQGIKYVYGLLPPRVRYGRVFWETYNFLQESQWWSREKLEEYQMQQLSKLLHHAYENVPYYRRIFEERGLTPRNIQSIDALRQLPLLSKSDIENRKHELVSVAHAPNKLEPAHTGGTTGSPLHFWYEKRVTQAKERAFFERMWRWHGYNSWRDRSVIITGAYQLGERIEFNPIEKCLILANPVFTPQKVEQYIEVIEKFQPRVLRGYPSLLWALAHFINRYEIKIKVPSLEVIFCNSEKVYDFQREEIRAAFSCKVVDHYGHNEMLALLQKCELNSEYHVIMEYGIIEILGSDGLPVSDGEMCGEIVATGFNNYAFPLIRYRTGDWVILSQDPTACACGRAYPRIKDVIGRSGDFILTPSKRLISPTNIEFAIRFMKNFKDVQIVQLRTDLIEIQIVPDQFFSQDEGKRFAEAVKARIGEDVQMKVTITDAIERPFGQKRRFIKSEISREFLGLKDEQ